MQHVQYSQVMELGEQLSRPGALATPVDVFRRTCRTVEGMRIASDLPSAAFFEELLEKGTADSCGTEDFRVEWAASRSRDGAVHRWSLRITHPDLERNHIHRQLQVHCRTGDDGVVVGVRLLFENPYGMFLEDEPPISPPNVTAQLLENWHGARCGLKLSKRFLHLQEHHRIASKIASPTRDVPVVVAGPRLFDRDRPIRIRREFGRLEWLLGGLACAVGLPNKRAVDSFNRAVDRSLSLENSSDVAILWPIEPGSTSRQLLERRDLYSAKSFGSAERLADAVFAKLAERSTFLDAGAIQTVEGLSAILNVKASGMARKTTRVSTATKRVEEAEELLEVALAENQEMRRGAAEAEERFNEYRAEAFALRARLRSGSRAASGRSVLLEAWTSWIRRLIKECPPVSVRAALETFAHAPFFTDNGGDRAVLLEESLESAERNRYRNPERLLLILMFACTDYLDAIRRGATGPELQTLAEAEGFRYGHRESSETLDKPALRSLREVRFEGETYLCRAHFKEGSGRDEKSLRVYLTVLDSGPRARILFGHIGGHLESASSGK